MSNEAYSGPSDFGPQTGEPMMEGAYADSADSPYADESEGGYLGGETDYYPWDDQPAPIESSGTWLNRGVWYAEIDALVLYRSWQKADTFVAANDQNVIIPESLPAVGLQLQTNRILRIPSDHPGSDAGVRGTLGRFLFRDDHNRDHTLEFTAWSTATGSATVWSHRRIPTDCLSPSTSTAVTACSISRLSSDYLRQPTQ